MPAGTEKSKKASETLKKRFLESALDSGNLFRFAHYRLMNKEYRRETIDPPTMPKSISQMMILLNLFRFAELAPVFFANIIPTFCFYSWHSLHQ